VEPNQVGVIIYYIIVYGVNAFSWSGERKSAAIQNVTDTFIINLVANDSDEDRSDLKSSSGDYRRCGIICLISFPYSSSKWTDVFKTEVSPTPMTSPGLHIICMYPYMHVHVQSIHEL
jgi:hypothetical protein